MPTIRILILIVFSLVTTLASANDHEAPAEEGHGEAKAEAAPAAHPVNLTPWVEVEAKIQELSAKVKTKQANLIKLFEEKNHLANNSPELKVKVQEIVKEHAEMRSLAAEYDKQLNLLKYRFPERNAKAARKYDRFEIKSVDDMEQAMGVDGKLTRNLRKVRSQYRTQKRDMASEAVGEVTPTTLKKQEGSIEDSGSIIMHK